MKRYAIVSKKDDVSRHLAALIKEELKELTYDEEHPEIVISVGGDGTMIYSIHRYEHVLNDVSFVGIHTGTLGFFTEQSPESKHLPYAAIFRSGPAANP